MTFRRTDYVPNPYFYDFTNNHLPSKKDFFITDIDLIFRDRDNNIMVIEHKCKSAVPSKCQGVTYQILHACFLHANGKPLRLLEFNLHKWRYYGYHLLQFENTTFENGKVFFDHKEVTQEQLIEILSFRSDALKICSSNNL